MKPKTLSELKNKSQYIWQGSTNSGAFWLCEFTLMFTLSYAKKRKIYSNFGHNISRNNSSNSGRPHDQTPGVCVSIPNYLCNLKNTDVTTCLQSLRILNIVDLIGLNKHKIPGSKWAGFLISELRVAPPNKPNNFSPPFIPTPEDGGKSSLRKDVGDFWRQTIDNVQNYSHDSDISVLIISFLGGSVPNSHLTTSRST
jgi:hypothetical protein